jgi:hypothetical protein
MVCCTGYCAAEAQFNNKVAERDPARVNDFETGAHGI